LLLFNATSGTTNPDYVLVVITRSSLALWLSVLVLAVWAAGLVFLVRERRSWWDFWLRERAFGWVAMLCVVAVAFVIIPAQRPRPSYLFSLSVYLMAGTGMFLFVLISRFRRLAWLSRGMPLVGLGLCMFVPGYYHAQPNEPLRLAT